MFDRLTLLALLPFVLPLSPGASEASQEPVVRVVLSDGDTLHAVQVRPWPSDMVAVEMPDAKTRYIASNKIRAVLDSGGGDQTAAVLQDRKAIPPSDERGPDGREASPARNRSGPSALAWRGRPFPETRSFLITEFGVLVRIDDYPYPGDDSRAAFSFDLGWMKNVSRHDAVGFSGYALVSEPTTRMGIRARYRRWLSRSTSIDISPGILLGGEDSAIEYDPPGFVLGATWNAGDLAALTIEAEYASNLDLVHDTPPLQWKERGDVAWRAGAKLGSGLGVLGAAGFFGLLLAVGLSGGFE